MDGSAATPPGQSPLDPKAPDVREQFKLRFSEEAVNIENRRLEELATIYKKTLRGTYP